MTLPRYTYLISWIDFDQTYLARCLEFPSLGANGDTPEKALAFLQRVVAAVCAAMDHKMEPLPKVLTHEYISELLELAQAVVDEATDGISREEWIQQPTGSPAKSGSSKQPNV